MTFKEFKEKAWSDHAKDPTAVAATLPDAFALLSTPSEVADFAQLITHVMGEHLARWSEGTALLHQLENHPLTSQSPDAAAATKRSIAIMEVTSGQLLNPAQPTNALLKDFSKSDKIRILATASGILTSLNQAQLALTLFLLCLESAHESLPTEDPANRAVAVTGNNMACTLEEKSQRTQIELELMILAAKTARKYWEIAGTWLQVERAEYRMANTYLCASEPQLALQHAKLCLSICQENSAPPLELFFVHEAIALAHQALNEDVLTIESIALVEHYFSKLNSTDQNWCQPAPERLKNVRALTSGQSAINSRQ